MISVKQVVIFKPTETSGFEVGGRLKRGEAETDLIVTKITIGLFGHVRISLSDGKAIYFKNCPITYEK